MPNFPVLSTGAISQYPLSRSVTFRTAIQRFVDGSDQRFREMTGNVKRWVIRFDRITEEERLALQSFVAGRQGRYDTFSFTDPTDGTEYPRCVLEQDTATFLWESEAACRTNLTIRTET